MSAAAHHRLEQIGALRALPVVAVTYALLLPIVLALGEPARRIAGCLLIAALVVHCLARPSGGWAVFFLAALPAATGSVLDDVIALPRWLGLCFLPFALVLAWFQDHPDEPHEDGVVPGRGGTVA